MATIQTEWQCPLRARGAGTQCRLTFWETGFGEKVSTALGVWCLYEKQRQLTPASAEQRSMETNKKKRKRLIWKQDVVPSGQHQISTKGMGCVDNPIFQNHNLLKMSETFSSLWFISGRMNQSNLIPLGKVFEPFIFILLPFWFWLILFLLWLQLIIRSDNHQVNNEKCKFYSTLCVCKTRCRFSLLRFHHLQRTVFLERFSTRLRKVRVEPCACWPLWGLI